MSDRVVVVAACLVLGLSAIVASSTSGIARGPAPLVAVERQVDEEREPGTDPADGSRPPVTTDPPTGDADRSTVRLTLPGVVAGLLLLALVAVTLAVIARLRVLVHRRRLGPAGLRAPPGVPATEAAADDEAVADALEAGLTALESGAPRNAVVAAWVVLEDAAARAGVPREVTDTATDLALRMLATHPVDPGALERLAALYREARFSAHAMTEQHRSEARGCLERLRSQLAGVAR